MKMTVVCKRGTVESNCNTCPFVNETEFGNMCNMQKHLKWSKDGNTLLKTVFTITMPGKGGRQKK